MPRTFATRAYRDAVVNMAPVSYWRLDEASGTRAYDQMATANHGLYVGSPAQGVTGPLADGAVRMTVSGGTWADMGGADVPQSAYSIAAWCYITTNPVQDGGIWGRWAGSKGAFIGKPSSAVIGFYWEGAGGGKHLDWTPSQSNGRWHFVVGTDDGTNNREYGDGVLIGSPIARTSPGQPAAGDHWYVGTYAYSPTTRIISGSYAECAYWSRALTAGEIAHLYAIGTGR